MVLLLLLALLQNKAPLPAPMVDAKSVFLVNASADSDVFDIFYAEMKAWKRYEIADSPDKADFIFELSVMSDNSGVYTNPANLRTYNYTKYKIKLAAMRNHVLLWSSTQPVKGTKKKDQQKAVKRIVEDLKSRLS